jgi:hydroxymethylpyrimidine/phosphomethylpyrimidine kinase
MPEKLPICLSIAGSDPSGGAGIQADLKTFARHGVYGAAAITLLTVQNTLGVQSVQVLDAALVEQQVRAVVTDLDVDVIKTGALGNLAVAQAIASALHDWRGQLVIDPVLVSKNGRALLSVVDAQAIARLLFSRATLVTPNLDEVELFVGRAVRSLEQMHVAAQELGLRWQTSVLVKGGHLTESDPCDVLWSNREFFAFPQSRIDSQHTHGTGCTYASAIAAHLAQGHALPEAVGLARTWLQEAIRHAPGIGKGQGPLWHGA